MSTTTVQFVLGPYWGNRDEVPLLADGMPPAVLWRNGPDGQQIPYLRRHLDRTQDWVYLYEPQIPPD